MAQLTGAGILDATGGKLISGDAGQRFLSVSTDSRSIRPGALFVPIVGEKFDGHDYVAAARESGAFGAVVSRDMASPGGDPTFVLIKVEDTVRALGAIASLFRGMFSARVVAVTGSVGKTSTKDMIASALSGRLNVLKSEANHNNEIGLPQTLLKLNAEHEAAVVEMGMRGLGEISWLSKIARPDVAVITNIGMAHIERLKTRENILRAKMEITDGLAADGTLILNGDDALLKGFKGLLPYKTYLYGMESGNDFMAENIVTRGENGVEFDVRISGAGLPAGVYHVRMPYPGMHNVSNTLAAISVAAVLGVAPDAAISGVGDWKPEKMRLNIVHSGDIKIIDDVYNANPHSMAAALGVLREVAGSGRSVAVLGDMLEIGSWSETAHADIGAQACKNGVNYIVAVGQYAYNVCEGARREGFADERMHTFTDNASAAQFLKELLLPGDVVLVKGSRGMKMEEIVQALTAAGTGGNEG